MYFCSFNVSFIYACPLPHPFETYQIKNKYLSAFIYSLYVKLLQKNEITIRPEVVKIVFSHKPVYVSLSSVRHRCKIFGPRDLSFYFVRCSLSPLRTVVRTQIVVRTLDIKHKNLKKKKKKKYA